MAFLVGAAIRDITPPFGLAMAGFAARTDGATGTHDPLRATALVVGNTAILSLDLLGVDRTVAQAISDDCGGDLSVTVVASHTHGGPVCLGPAVDPDWRAILIDRAVQAVRAAADARRPAQLMAGQGAAPNIARNRRHADGPTDQSLPVLRFQDSTGVIAILVTYACHPTVLGADNRLWTADWHGPLRHGLEQAHPGAVAITLTGCTADANIGHSAASSVSLATSDARSFRTAEVAAARIAEAALSAALSPASDDTVAAAGVDVELGYERQETGSDQALLRDWSMQLKEADRARAALLRIWADWAGHEPRRRLLTGASISVPVTVLRWGGIPIICMPGEIFAETAHQLRRRIGRPDAVVLSYAGDNPGYIAPRSEFAHGGYEIAEAHRYYDQPATFAPGSAERLVDAAAGLFGALFK